MKKEKWRDHPKLIKKIREISEVGVVLLPYRQTKIFVSKEKEKLPLPSRLLFSAEALRRELPNSQVEEILKKIFPASLLFHFKEKEYLTLASDPILEKIFPESEEIFLSEWEEEKNWEVGLWVEKEAEKIKPFTILNVQTNPFLLEKKGEVGILEIERAIGEKIKLAPSLIFSVLIVCTGNTCRSPMAKGILENLLKGDRVFIYSAGTNGLKNSPPSDYAQKAVARFGGDISRHLSQPLTKEMIEDADLILVMEKRHLLRIKEMVPEAESKTFMLSGYPEKEGEDILDPIGLSYETFLEVGEEMKTYLAKVALDIKERL
ncbi:MAG: low molecular weight protein arginine phosphatase [candidate division WOR-3 bacterium]